MKISKKEQAKTREKILKTAIELIGENGYKKTSMSKIAKKAKIGEATIYNYFPTKEDILYEYFYSLQIKSKKKLLEIEEFNSFSLKEQIQLLLNTQLEILREDRSFVLEVFSEVFYKPFSNYGFKKGEEELLLMVEELVDIAIDANEIEPIDFGSLFKGLFSNYYYGVIYYWIYDKSDNFNNTTVMLDKSLDVMYAALQSGIITKAQELFAFIVKTHILSYIKPLKKYNKREFGKWKEHQ